MEGANGILWWYWPEAHEYFINPFGIFMCGTAVFCDIVYPFLLWQIRRSEGAGKAATVTFKSKKEL
jgi:hypothetical protein